MSKTSTIDFDTSSISEGLSIRHLSPSAFHFTVFDVTLEEKIDPSSAHPRYSYSPSRARMARHCCIMRTKSARKEAILPVAILL